MLPVSRRISTRKYFYLGGGLAFMVLAWTFKPFTIINVGERGVIMNFGQVQERVLDEGFHFVLPVYTRIHKMNVRIQKTDVTTTIGTKDLQSLNVNASINWHINPLAVNHLYQQVGSVNVIQSNIITPAISEVMKATTPQRTAEEILKQRTELKNEVDIAIQKRLKKYHIIVDDVSLVKISFSPDFTKSIEQKQIAEQEAKQAEYEAIKASKQAEAEVNRAKGTATAQQLLKQSLNSDLLQKQAIEKWDGKFPTMMGGNGVLPFVNIDAQFKTK
jgi:prohibitin 1